ncbi:hypothetical protein J6590_100327, partial [Homalodisca vitripennis]
MAEVLIQEEVSDLAVNWAARVTEPARRGASITNLLGLLYLRTVYSITNETLSSTLVMSV